MSFKRRQRTELMIEYGQDQVYEFANKINKK